MRTVRIIKRVKRDGALVSIETDYPCSTIRKVFWDNGIDIIMDDVDGVQGKRIKLEMPRDGKQVYFMNDAGDTTDSLRWPPKRGTSDVVNSGEPVALRVMG